MTEQEAKYECTLAEMSGVRTVRERGSPGWRGNHDRGHRRARGRVRVRTIIGPRTREQLDDLLAAVDITLTDEILDRIDEIVPPGTNVGAPDQSDYVPSAIWSTRLRRRPIEERSAA